MLLLAAFVTALLGATTAQYNQQQTTPVPILKQINRHNEDGSYSYGYEAADGSFRIESKHPTGEVYGKYGYVDDAGKVREVEYGASRRGFEPAGTDISVPPPTIHQTGGVPDYDDDGQYREDPRMYYQEQGTNTVSSGGRGGVYSGQSRFDTGFGGFGNSKPAQRPQQYVQPQQYAQPKQYAQPQQYVQPQQYASRPADVAPRRPVAVDPSIFRGHPASNFDVNSGSYSVNYSG